MLGNTSLLAAARAAAITAATSIPAANPDSVEYTSRGVVLVTGIAARVMKTLAHFAAPLRIVAFVPDAADAVAVTHNVRLVAAPILSLTGHFGRFSATTVSVNGESVDAGRFGWNEDHHFDLVLDLNASPLLSHEVSPYGYFAPSTDAELAAALVQIRDQPANWRKPRYFDYRSELCAHGAAGVVGCTRCLDVCPAGAIADAGDKVRFDPFLCQGCATCTVVCPEAAVRYAFPPANTTLDQLHAMLNAWRATGADPPQLVVWPVGDQRAETREPPFSSPGSLPFPVHALASFGIEAWFAALAWGAGQIVLAPGSATEPASLRAVNEELLVAHTILAALGEVPDRIVRADNAKAIPGPTPERMGAIAGTLSRESKRSTLYAALDHLSQMGAHPNQPIPLPPGASLGAVEVNQDRCTVCFACVNLCPTHALTSAEGSLPELRFTESRCVQCGLCEHGCPERAISLVPQFEIRRSAREEFRALCADESFNCTKCGTPFISKRMLTRSMEMMKDHPLLKQEGIDRLKLCMACRADATMREMTASGN